MKRALLIACAMLALDAGAVVTAKDAWVRGTVPGQATTGAFVTLQSSEDAAVVAVETPAAHRAEIHASDMKDGIMRMRPMPRVPLPAGRPVELQGGTHVMLMELAHPLHEGESVPLRFVIEDRAGHRTTLDVSAPVRPLGR